jgi:hypothetical protein
MTVYFRALFHKANRGELIIHLLKYLKNNADLEAKAHFLHYIAENIQDQALFMILLQEWNKKIEVDEKWIKKLYFISFQNIRKIIVRS